MPVGLARINMGWGTQHSAVVLYEGGRSLEIPEETYRAAGYTPPFDQLKWQVVASK